MIRAKSCYFRVCIVLKKVEVQRHCPKGTYCVSPVQDLADVDIAAVRDRRGKLTSARGLTAGWNDLYAVMLW